MFCAGNQRSEIRYKIAVKMYLRKHNIIYYEEQVVFDAEQEKQLAADNYQILQRSYKVNQLVPLGYTAECLFTQLKNSSKSRIDYDQEFSLEQFGYTE